MNLLGRSVPVVLLALAVTAGATALPPRPMDAAEVRLALKKLRVLGSVLYVAAHPDDENSTLLTYFGKGRLLRAGYLALTRGEGGQNLIGSEKGDALGVLRTEELLAARGIDGAEQFFTRAIDFGYSKTPAEAIGLWGEEEVLSDMVRVIRAFRPDVIVTRFSPETGGHGQHTASAILARKAFELAGDPEFRAGEPGGPAPWQAKRLLFNVSTWMLRQFDTTGTIRVNIGVYNPLLGKSYNEIAGLSRSMHKSQGFGAEQSRGDVINYFRHTAGDSAEADLFEDIDMGWSRVPGARRLDSLLLRATGLLDPEDPSGIVPVLLDALAEMDALPDDPWTAVKRRDLLDLVQACSGLWIDALSADFSASPGDSLTVTASVINRSGIDFRLRRVILTPFGADTAMNLPLRYNEEHEIRFSVTVPPDEPATVPYWLRLPSTGFRYDVPDRAEIGMAGSAPRYSARLTVAAGDTEFDVVAPVRYTRVDPVEGQVYRPFSVSPPVLLNPVERVLLFPDAREKQLTVRLAAERSGVTGTVRLEMPQGWTATPAAAPFNAGPRGTEQRLTFTIRAAADAASGDFRIVADAGDRTWEYAREIIRYPHIPTQALFLPSGGKLLRLPVTRKKSLIGYVAGSGDEVPEGLRQVGYDVRLLTDEEIASADLSGFGTIIAGVRAYNTRPALASARQRFMEYVRGGGTYIVQYVTRGNMETDEIAPYPLRISRDRVADETAPVTFLAPDHPVLNHPNAIGGRDFDGWVQERGLYFADQWDTAYTAVMSSNDPGEPPRNGGLLVARYGRGYYCYTGLSFFRQLPAGVPGAYRLFVNLVELGTTNTSADGK